MLKKTICSFTFMLFLFICSYASGVSHNSIPFIGAQIFIEPGQTEQQVEQWFALLKETKLNTCRIRMFGRYMKTNDGKWDFSIFDRAFRLAAKYHINVYATLFPDTDFTDVGGFKFPHSQTHQKDVEEYIHQVVSHFSKYSNLVAWVLINEPGTPNLPFDEEFTQEKFSEWKKQHPFQDYNSQGYPIVNFEKEKFIVDYHNWYLNWLANQVRQYDSSHDLHINPHNIFKLSPCYDFPAWRSFLSSLGGSAHASWHFSYFPRSEYHVAMSANAELIRSGAGNLPWLMTELQGGNNTYSGANPLCPTSEEITQWLWINFATEAKGGIFWSFNGRATGTEAGEWAMIDFQNRPSNRLLAAQNIGDFIEKHSDMMADIHTLNSGITILYNRESMWVEALLTRGKNNGNGRSIGATMCSSLAYFETLSELGLQSNFCEFNEFDFSKKDYSNQVIILSHQIALNKEGITQLEQFVKKGGTLIADGLTGFYDYNAHSTMVSGFALEPLFGSLPVEFKMVKNLFSLDMSDEVLPAHLWKGTIETIKACPITNSEGETIASINRYGKGRAIWVPSPLGLGAREAKDYSKLGEWIIKQLPQKLLKDNIHFTKHQKGLIMKSFYSQGTNYSLLINKSGDEQTLSICGIKNSKPSILFADKEAKANQNKITIASEGTIIIKWEK